MVCECQIFDGTQENKLEDGDAGYQILPCFQTDKDDIPAYEDITNKYEYSIISTGTEWYTAWVVILSARVMREAIPTRTAPLITAALLKFSP